MTVGKRGSLRERFLAGARRTKHHCFLGRLWVKDRLSAAADVAHRSLSAARPYQFDAETHRDSFVAATCEHVSVPPTGPARQVFVLWTGTNEMSVNRTEALEELQRNNPLLQIHVVNPRSLSEYVLARHPLHPAYGDLSLVHRSDYLRAYLLHHYGGVYCDVKRGYGDLRASLDSIEHKPDVWVLGYRELSSTLVAQVPGSVGSALRRHYKRVVGNGAYVVRRGLRSPASGWQRSSDGWIATP